jgi:hypothetical protein
MKKLLLWSFLLFSCTQVFAQKKTATEQSLNVSAAVGNREFSTAFMYQHLWLLGKQQKFKIGAGLRLTNYFGFDRYFTTAPAKLTSGQSGPGVLFSEDIPQNIDSIILNHSQVNALNLSVNMEYKLSQKIRLGFNIDAIGFSFGGKKSGSYLGNNGVGAATTAKPTTFNLLLISDNDLGSLNSEFFAAYQYNKKWSAKLGFQFLFAEYTTNTKVQTTPDFQTNDRFRNKSSAISLGIIYSF